MTITLREPDLGDLTIDCEPFTLVSYTIGRPAPRPVQTLRALADGVVDDTHYTGARAVTVAVRLNEDVGRCGTTTIQQLVDMLMPYMSVKRRPVLEYAMPFSPGDVRRMVLRPDDAPITIDAPRHPIITCSWTCPDGEITSARGGPNDDGLFCQTIRPSDDTEAGRTYDLIFDRVYPPSAGVGERIINVSGNTDAHWTATIYGGVTDPTLRVNGIDITFAANGGMTLLDGQFVTIDTRAKTILYNNDPTESRYNRTNYVEWEWADLLLHPGENRVRYTGLAMSPTAEVRFCWRPTWEA